MSKEKAIDIQLIKPVAAGTPAAKGKIFLKNLFKEYLTKLNVGFYDSCCDDPATCPPISADLGNTIECRPDGLFSAGGGGGGSLVDANNGLSVLTDTVQLGQTVAQAGNPARLLDNRELPLNN